MHGLCCTFVYFTYGIDHRWEAERLPNVKVAKVERSKVNKEQSVYMPQIPDIATCPEHLLPLKEWEDEFLADFSKLRQVFLSLSLSLFPPPPFVLVISNVSFMWFHLPWCLIVLLLFFLGGGGRS